MTAVVPESTQSFPAAKRRLVSNIVLPLDGSELSRAAVPIAHTFVKLYGATPHLVHAGERAVDPQARIVHLGVQWEELPGAVIDQSGTSAPETILGLAERLPGSLIVMCTHTGHNRNPDRFGSVAEAVLAGNPARILLVAPERGQKAFNLRQLLLPHDGTPAAAVAAGHAAEIATDSHASIIALHVAAAQAGCPRQPGSLPAPQYMDQPQHEWPSWAGEFSARMLALGAPASSIRFEVLITGGQPGPEVAHLARERNADMVVMANYGAWKTSRHNTARVVIQNSGCPVLLVHSNIEVSGLAGSKSK